MGLKKACWNCKYQETKINEKGYGFSWCNCHNKLCNEVLARPDYMEEEAYCDKWENGIDELVDEEKASLYDEHHKIEQELGIDLVTLFKALKNGAFVKDWRYCDFVQDCYLTRGVSGKDNKIVWKVSYGALNDDLVELRDYGKTWALTKEELEK